MAPTRVLRFEGFDYEIQQEEASPGISVAVRPGTKPSPEAFETPEAHGAALTEWRSTAPCAEVKFATRELCDSGEGFFYLPRRVAKPLGGDYLEPKDGQPGRWLVLPHPLRDAIRQHPLWIAGRDDLAIAKVEKALAE